MAGFIPFGEKTLIMGIINVSPDSFYKGSMVAEVEDAVAQALLFEELGADIIDIGGESTRPGSSAISVEEELKRVMPVIEGIRKKCSIFVSVDTYKAAVAARAIDLGVHIINDVSGLGTDTSDELGQRVAESGVYIVLMHMRGTARTMQQYAHYSHVAEEVSAELDRSIERALKAGIDRRKIIIDPGIGFAKLPEHNLSLLKNLPALRKKGYTLLIGLSRKSFLGVYSGENPDDRLIPTVAANAISIFQGADIIRVHDVKEAVETARVVDDIKQAL